MCLKEWSTQLLPLLSPDDPFHEIRACLFGLSRDGIIKRLFSVGIITVIKRVFYSTDISHAGSSRPTAEPDERHAWVCDMRFTAIHSASKL